MSAPQAGRPTRADVSRHSIAPGLRCTDLATVSRLRTPRPTTDDRTQKNHPVPAASHPHQPETCKNTPYLINRHCHQLTDTKPTHRNQGPGRGVRTLEPETASPSMRWGGRCGMRACAG